MKVEYKYLLNRPKYIGFILNSMYYKSIYSWNIKYVVLHYVKVIQCIINMFTIV